MRTKPTHIKISMSLAFRRHRSLEHLVQHVAEIDCCGECQTQTSTDNSFRNALGFPSRGNNKAGKADSRSSIEFTRLDDQVGADRLNKVRIDNWNIPSAEWNRACAAAFFGHSVPPVECEGRLYSYVPARWKI